MNQSLTAFREAWGDLRRLTYEFIEAVPDHRWSYSPHPSYAAFCKQVRHLVCVQGVYHQGLTERKVDFARKHSHYSGSLERTELLAALHAKDAELDAILARLGDEGAAGLVIEFFGHRWGFARYGAVMLQHEAIHHGEWSFYAALGGFSSPLGWKLNWGL
jgi:hypothetical protein